MDKGVIIMANSPSHRLGELIGDFFETSIVKYLIPIIEEKRYYLDYKHPRKARNNAKEVTGIDSEGNKHKLDIVIEANGSEDKLGTPKAFIEMAWRRYTKHSKAKVQEISGAILPLVKTYKQNCPFYAAVLSGEFTKNSITQLESQGFYVIHFPYESMCELYKDAVEIDIAWEEKTPDEYIEKIAHNICTLTKAQLNKLQKAFYEKNEEKLKALANAVKEALDQTVEKIIVIPIHGNRQVLLSIDDAVKYIRDYDVFNSKVPILRYEIILQYTSGDEYTMKCNSKHKAIQFLNQYK